MMHDFAYAAAARQARFVIIGLELKPYSIGHELLLLQQGNPLLLDSDRFSKLPFEDQYRAVIRAVLICSRDWRSNQRPHKWMRFWSWKNRNADYALAIADFRNYRQQGSTHPPAPEAEAYMISNKDDSNSAREKGSPILARVYNHVCAMPDREIFNYGRTAYDFPLGLGLFLWLSRLEEDDRAVIENSDEVDAKEKMAKIREDARAAVSEMTKEEPCPAS